MPVAFPRFPAPPRSVAAVLVLVVALAGAVPARAVDTASWAWVTAFRSGAVYVVDVGAARLVRIIPVDDADATTGLCVTADGRRAVVVDGAARGRVRVLDGLTGAVLSEARVGSRRRGLTAFPSACLSSDGAWAFIDTARGTRVLEVGSGHLLDANLTLSGVTVRQVVGGGGDPFALVGDRVVSFRLLDRRRATGVITASTRLSLSDVADIAAARDGARLFAIAAVPPMRALPPPAPAPRPAKRGRPPAPSPSSPPNPALREGPWRLVRWAMGASKVQAVDLVRRVDLEKVSAAEPPRLALSPDGRRLALVYGMRAWIIDAETLEVRCEIFPPGLAAGAVFSADGDALLTVVDQSLLCIRLANRSWRTLLPGQMRLLSAPLIAVSRRPAAVASPSVRGARTAAAQSHGNGRALLRGLAWLLGERVCR